MNELETIARVPPNDQQAEAELVGFVLLRPEEASGLVVSLDADAFYKAAHGEVWRAAQTLVSWGVPCGMIEVDDELKASGALERVGGSGFLVELADGALPDATRAASACRIVKEKAQARAIIKVCVEAVREIHTTGRSDPSALAGKLAPMLTGSSGTDVVRIGETMLQIVEGLDTPPPETHGSGLADVDAMIGASCTPGALIVAAGRPSSGKTTLALNWGRHRAERGTATLFVSLEVSPEALATDVLAAETGINSYRVRRHDLDRSDLEALAGAMSKHLSLPLYVTTTGTMDVMKLRAILDMERVRHGVRFVVVDYLQRLGCKAAQGDGRYREVSAISGALKGMALDLGVTMLCLAQLNRASETQGRRPRASDLRDSGTIEQDADVILLLHRGEDDKVTEIDVAKQRHGPTGAVRVRYDRTMACFQNLARGQ